MTKFNVINTPIHNIDGIAKVTGRAEYTFDVSLPHMLHGKILRSPYPHAKILNIDTSQAEALPGVKAVVTGKDTLGVLELQNEFKKGDSNSPIRIEFKEIPSSKQIYNMFE